MCDICSVDRTSRLFQPVLGAIVKREITNTYKIHSHHSKFLIHYLIFKFEIMKSFLNQLLLKRTRNAYCLFSWKSTSRNIDSIFNQLIDEKSSNTGWKKRFSKNGYLLETIRNRDISSFSLVSISGTPMWFPLDFHTLKQSTRGFHLDSLNLKLGGNLTSGLHEFPHQETVNPRIPPRFLALETSGNLTGGFHEFPRLETVNPRI